MAEKKTSTKPTKKLKARNWTFIVYPESAPKNWREILDKTNMMWVESPIHDKDVNADGEIKKAHYHILLIADGPTTLNNVTEIVSALNSPIPQVCNSARGLIRYMIHLDNPEKYQYDKSDIIGHNGAEVESYFELTATNRIGLMKEMVAYIFENNIDNYAEFLMHCILENDDWFEVAVNHNTLAINKMIDAMYQRNMRKNNS